MTPSEASWEVLLACTSKLVLLPSRNDVKAGVFDTAEVRRVVGDHSFGLDRDDACVLDEYSVRCGELERVADAEVERRDRCLAGRVMGPFGAIPAVVLWVAPDRCDPRAREVPQLEFGTEAPDDECRVAVFGGHLRMAGRATAAWWPHGLMVSAARST